MKKMLQCLLVALCLMLTLTAIPAQAAIVTNAERVLFRDGADAFLELVKPHGIGTIYLQEGYSELSVWSPDSPVVAVEDQEFGTQVRYAIRMQETNGVGFTVDVVQFFYYTPWKEIVQGHSAFEDEQVYVPAYGSYEFRAGGPRSGNYRYEIVVVNGTDDNGHKLEFYGIVERLNFVDQNLSGADAVEADAAHDTENLRYNADFEVEVADGIWWVPVVSLGESRYTNHEIALQVENTPEEKQAAMDTLYEALQLFQVGNFANGNDNERIREGDVDWEHHKPGYHAVRTNMGCCATDSNWLNYILKDNYEQVGFLAYSQADGGGHILNYIYHEGYYYFIDLTHYRTDFLDSSAPETGLIGDYQQSDFIAGNLHKAVSPEAYVAYCRAKYNDPPELFFLYQADDCLPVDGVRGAKGICITYANTVDVQVVYDDPKDSLTYAFVEPPKKSFAWEDQASAQFVVDEQYLVEAAEVEETAQQPFFQAGDVLSLGDYGQQAKFCEINGEDYFLCGMNQYGRFGFEGEIMLYGGNHYSYLGLELPVSLHRKALEKMDSLLIGEGLIDIIRDVKNVQIARCVRQGDELLVTDVMQAKCYFEPVYMHKDENGRWQSSEELWYIIHYEADGELQKEYGRVHCGVTN